MASPSTLTSSADKYGGADMSSIHPDIIRAHILTRLDGQTLVSLGCSSSELQALCSHKEIWREICTSMWPSLEDPLVRRVISAFPGGHRSLFSVSFPLLGHRPSPNKCTANPYLTSELISAVDIRYKGELIFSKAQSTETSTGWFLSSPFRVDLLDPKEMVPTPIQNSFRDNNSDNSPTSLLEHLEENVTLSWVMIDPTLKRGANLSSRRPVTVERHWLTGEINLRYSIIMSAASQGSALDFVECAIRVNLGVGKEGGKMVVKEVNLTVEDMEGRYLNGMESLKNLQAAMEGGQRKRERGGAAEVRERFEEFLERKKERRERGQRREKALDMACISVVIYIFLTLFSLLLFR